LASCILMKVRRMRTQNFAWKESGVFDHIERVPQPQEVAGFLKAGDSIRLSIQNKTPNSYAVQISIESGIRIAGLSCIVRLARLSIFVASRALAASTRSCFNIGRRRST